MMRIFIVQVHDPVIHLDCSIVYLQYTNTLYQTHTENNTHVWHAIRHTQLTTLVLILLYQLNTRVVIKARQGSIKPVPCGVTNVYRGQLLHILLFNK